MAEQKLCRMARTAGKQTEYTARIQGFLFVAPEILSGSGKTVAGKAHDFTGGPGSDSPFFAVVERR